MGEMLYVVYGGCETDVGMCVRTSYCGVGLKNKIILHTPYDAKIFVDEDIFPTGSEVDLIGIIALKYKYAYRFKQRNIT
jgi:hypothetical protein